MQIPYEGIGIGIAVIFGIWAFTVAETVKERTVIAVVAAIVSLVPIIFPSRVGRLVALIEWMFYGLACIIYLRYHGMEIR